VKFSWMRRRHEGEPSLSTAAPLFRLPGGRSTSPGRPGVFGEDHPPVSQPGAFGFEQAPLKAGKGLADHDSAARGNHAVPRNSLTARASSHGSARGASPASEPRGASQLAIGEYARLGDALNERVDFAPARCHVLKITAVNMDCQFCHFRDTLGNRTGRKSHSRGI
jgi:hypothetical protein